MKRKEKESLKNLSVDELRAKLREVREKQFKIGFHHKAVSVGNPLEIRALRRHAARLTTWIREKQPRPSAGAAR